MSTEEIYESLTEIFCDVFDDDSLLIEPSTNAEDIEDWDSLAQINLLVAVEQEFGVKFSIEEATSFTCVGDMVEAIVAKI